MPLAKDVTSIGRLACELQSPVHEIQGLAKQFGVQPEFVIDGVPHFDTAAISFFSEKLRELRNRSSRS